MRKEIPVLLINSLLKVYVEKKRKQFFKGPFQGSALILYSLKTFEAL